MILVIVVQLIVNKYRTVHRSRYSEGYCAVHLILDTLRIVGNCHLDDVARKYSHRDTNSKEDDGYNIEDNNSFGKGRDG